jgi:hypothetical protein
MGVTGGERYAGKQSEAEMIHLSTILSTLTRFEAVIAHLGKAVRDIGERMNRRTTNSRWMNG